MCDVLMLSCVVRCLLIVVCVLLDYCCAFIDVDVLLFLVVVLFA